ncbi:hypothetical protein OQA88_6578 [Cercophora sp. LCS_1]
MGSKRGNPTPGDELSEPSNKRRRDQVPSKPKVPEAKTDAVYGQRSVFPTLDQPTYPSDEDLEFEDEADALAYLKSVRQEAETIPHLLVAPKAGPQLPPHLYGTDDDIDRGIYDNGVGDSRGFFHDGTYIAAPDTESSDEGEYHGSDWASQNNPTQALRQSYFTSLITQFETQRAQLHADPPQELVAALDKDHGTYVGKFGPKSWTFKVWSHRFRNTDPLPAQIAAMDQRGALKLLRVILGGKFIRRGYELKERTSRWIWALLARLPGRGEMDYADIGWVRELGKRAVLMMVSIAQLDALQGEVDDDLEGEEMEEEDDDSFLFAAADLNDAADQQIAGTLTDLPSDTLAPAAADNDGDVDDQEVDMDLDDGEVTDDSSIPGNTQADIAAAKARLLAQLETVAGTDDDSPDPATDAKAEAEAGAARAHGNMRATLNMILTVAGEFYGQTDLLEFRDPFPQV